MKGVRAILSTGLAPFCNTFPNLSHKGHDFRKKKSYWTWYTGFDFICNFFFWKISHYKKNWARYDRKCL